MGWAWAGNSGKSETPHRIGVARRGRQSTGPFPRLGVTSTTRCFVIGCSLDVDEVVLADGHDCLRRDERRQRRGIQPPRVLVEPQSVGREEGVIGISVDLGALPPSRRVLDGDLVDPKLERHLIERPLVGRFQIHPDGDTGLAEVLRNVIDQEVLEQQRPVTVEASRGHGGSVGARSPCVPSKRYQRYVARLVPTRVCNRITACPAAGGMVCVVSADCW